MRSVVLIVSALLAFSASAAEPFQLPTANRALFDNDGGERFFVGTVGRTWHSGMFGCVRSEGWQMHEGIDIKALQRDKAGEPIDPVMATADGVVAYINDKPALSSFGNYILIRHDIQGLEIYSNYAHLRSIRPGLAVGQRVKAGENIAVLGRTANTGQGISKERAHLHFELTLMRHDRFAEWNAKANPGQRNDHGTWNGRNFVGLDPYLIFLEQRASAGRFSLLRFIQDQEELCRVLVRRTDFPWVKRYAPLVRRNPRAEKEGVAGYEIALNYNGLPYQLIPRAASEIPGDGRHQLLSVNETAYEKHPCRKLVVKRGSTWELTGQGTALLDLLTY